MMTKKIRGKKLFNWIVPIFFILFSLYVFFGIKSREKHLSGDNVKYTIAKIIALKQGSKTGPWFDYQFSFNEKQYTSKYELNRKLRKLSFSSQKSYIGKNFLVKYSVKKPKFNEIFIGKPIPDSLHNCNTCIWDKPPF